MGSELNAFMSLSVSFAKWLPCCCFCWLVIKYKYFISSNKMLLRYLWKDSRESQTSWNPRTILKNISIQRFYISRLEKKNIYIYAQVLWLRIKPKFTPSPPCLTIDIKCLCSHAVLTLYLMATHPYFGLVGPKNTAWEVVWFVQMQLCKPKLCYHVLFREKRLFSCCLFLTVLS